MGAIDAMAVQDFENAMDVMFWDAVYTTFAALPHMRRRGSGLARLNGPGRRHPNFTKALDASIKGDGESGGETIS